MQKNPRALIYPWMILILIQLKKQLSSASVGHASIHKAMLFFKKGQTDPLNKNAAKIARTVYKNDSNVARYFVNSDNRPTSFSALHKVYQIDRLSAIT